MTSTTDANNDTTTYAYNADNNLTAETDADNNVTTYAYDSRNRLTQETNPQGHPATYAYDADNNLTSSTDADGRVDNYSYDSLNRVTTVVWLNSAGTHVNTLTYKYDADNNLTAASASSGTYTMTYDALDRVSTVKEPFSQTLTYAYDSDNNRTLITDSQKGVTTAVYNKADLLVTQLFGGTSQTPLRVDLTYNSNEQVATVIRYSNLTATATVGSTTYSYDTNERLTSIQDRNSAGSLIANFTYTYDKADRVTSEQLNGATTTYAYDARSDLTSVATSSGTTTYNFDANGNPNNSGDNVGTENQLTTDGTWTYTYDNVGNLTEKSQGPNGLTWMYTYDNRNELLTAEELTKPGGTVLSLSTYTYDVFGNQLSVNQTNGGVTTLTNYAYLDGNSADPVIWADLNSGNALVTRRLYLPGQVTPYARISSAGTAAWYLTDWEGSVRFITDNTGAVQDQITYTGFGGIASETNSSFGDRYKYTGEQLDAVTGLQRNGWRYYNSATGQWISQDPLGLAPGPNPYEYCGDDPPNGTDPTGLVDLGDLFVESIHGIASAISGFIGVASGPTIRNRTIGDLVGQYSEFNQSQMIPNFEATFGKDTYNALKNKQSAVRVTKEGASVIGNYYFGVDFTIQPCQNGTFIQRVTNTTKYFKANGFEDTSKRVTKLTIEGWPIVKGVSQTGDIHSGSKITLVADGKAKVVRQVELDIGFGSFVIAGENEFAKVEKYRELYTDSAIGDDEPKARPIYWLGNVVKYFITFEINGDGTWSLNVSRAGPGKNNTIISRKGNTSTPVGE
jgi:RHS repeat-associated protein